jgi:hypothetical protein
LISNVPSLVVTVSAIDVHFITQILVFAPNFAKSPSFRCV